MGLDQSNQIAGYTTQNEPVYYKDVNPSFMRIINMDGKISPQNFKRIFQEGQKHVYSMMGILNISPQMRRTILSSSY